MKLIYKMNDSKTSYTVTGITLEEDETIPTVLIIPDVYRGLPVIYVSFDLLDSTNDVMNNITDLVLGNNLVLVTSKGSVLLNGSNLKRIYIGSSNCLISDIAVSSRIGPNVTDIYYNHNRSSDIATTNSAGHPIVHHKGNLNIKYQIIGDYVNKTPLLLESYDATGKVATKLSELEDDETHRLVTDEEKDTWNNKSDFSGEYNDLENKPLSKRPPYNGKITVNQNLINDPNALVTEPVKITDTYNNCVMTVSFVKLSDLEVDSESTIFSIDFTSTSLLNEMNVQTQAGDSRIPIYNRSNEIIGYYLTFRLTGTDNKLPYSVRVWVVAIEEAGHGKIDSKEVYFQKAGLYLSWFEYSAETYVNFVSSIAFNDVYFPLDEHYLPKHIVQGASTGLNAQKLIAELRTKHDDEFNSLNSKISGVMKNVNTLVHEQKMLYLEELPEGRTNQIVALTSDTRESIGKINVKVDNRQDLQSDDGTIDLSDVSLVKNVKIDLSRTKPTKDEIIDAESVVLNLNAETTGIEADYLKVGLFVCDKERLNGVKFLYVCHLFPDYSPTIIATKIAEGVESEPLYYICDKTPLDESKETLIEGSGWHRFIDGEYTKVSEEDLADFSMEFDEACILDYWSVMDAESYEQAINESYYVMHPWGFGEIIGSFVTIPFKKGFYEAVEDTVFERFTWKPYTSSVSDNVATKDDLNQLLDSFAAMLDAANREVI